MAVGLTSGDSIGMRSWKFNPGDPELPMELSYNSFKPSVQKMPIHPRCREEIAGMRLKATNCRMWFLMISCSYIPQNSYGQNLVHGEGTSLSRVGPYRFCSAGTLYKPSWGYRFGYRFRVGPYQFCSNGNPTTLSILLWSYLILSDTQWNLKTDDF